MITGIPNSERMTSEDLEARRARIEKGNEAIREARAPSWAVTFASIETYFVVGDSIFFAKG
jgi:hypothetical protein